MNHPSLEHHFLQSEDAPWSRMAAPICPQCQQIENKTNGLSMSFALEVLPIIRRIVRTSCKRARWPVDRCELTIGRTNTFKNQRQTSREQQRIIVLRKGAPTPPPYTSSEPIRQLLVTVDQFPPKCNVCFCLGSKSFKTSASQSPCKWPSSTLDIEKQGEHKRTEEHFLTQLPSTRSFSA